MILRDHAHYLGVKYGVLIRATELTSSRFDGRCDYHYHCFVLFFLFSFLLIYLKNTSVCFTCEDSPGMEFVAL